MSRFRFLIFTSCSLYALVLTARVGTQESSAAPHAGGPATFVGSTTCASCHQRVYDTWKGGRHSKMIQPATAASVKGDFARGSVTLRGSRYGLQVENGQFYITETYLTGEEQKHPVEYTLGSRRIQHYLTTIDHGKIMVLPPSWDVRRREWFHNMEIVRPDEDDEQRVQQWNKSCVGCHVSEEDVHYDPATRTYATAWRDFGTSCERCHGPGSAHVQQYTRSTDSRPPADRLIVKPTRLDPATGSMVCAQCHALGNSVSPGFVAGANYYDYFQPVLEYGPRADYDPTYWTDGRPRRFSNDAIGLWESQCFLRGGATCTSCHQDPHEPDIDRNAQLAPTSNALCTTCHADIGQALTAHTRHRAASNGSSCVECHMPRTVISIRSTMRDHTMSLPAPETTVAFGIPNACTECHENKSAKWAVDALQAWWPNGERAKYLARAQAFTAARARRPDALDRLVAIADDERQGPLIQANALGYLPNYTDARASAALIRASESEAPVVRAVAMLGLGRTHLTDGSERQVLLAGLDDPRRAVRIAALLSLANSARGQLTAGDQARFVRVSREFASAARLREDDAGTQRDLGFLELLNGEFSQAASALANSLGLEPDRPSTRYLLGLARLGQGRLRDAGELFGRVSRSDPSYGAAREQLKLLAASPH